MKNNNIINDDQSNLSFPPIHSDIVLYADCKFEVGHKDCEYSTEIWSKSLALLFFRNFSSGTIESLVLRTL